jgi:hypothetical protein
MPERPDPAGPEARAVPLLPAVKPSELHLARTVRFAGRAVEAHRLAGFPALASGLGALLPRSR